MAALYRSVANLGRNVIITQRSRNISLSSITRIKEIIITKEGNTLTIDSEIKEQEDKYRLLKSNKKNGSCILCSHNIEVKHTDVLILTQFLDSNGELLKRTVTGLCRIQYKRIEYLIKMAKAAGLIPSSMIKEKPAGSCPWEKYNTYYDEDTIKYKYF